MADAPLPAAAAGERILEPSGKVMQAWVDEAMGHIVRHLESLAEQPAGYDPAAPLPPLLGPPGIPRQSMPLSTLLEWLFHTAVPASYNTAAPGYMAYIPSGGLFHAALADLIAASINRYVGVHVAAPLLAGLEAEVLDWLRLMMELPASTRGVLTTGGSMANFTAVVTARHQHLGEDLERGVIYTSTQTHHSVAKAAMLAGIRRGNVRALEPGAGWRLEGETVARAVAADRRQGDVPFLVVGSAGTTNTGAVDHLPELADVCARQGLWMHVDAAYGGFFRLTAAGKRLLRGIERADSVTLDPHKGLFLPYGTGALLVRDGEALRRAHAVSADYMPARSPGREGIDFSDHGMELSRDFRGLRLWLPMRLHGIEPFAQALQEKLDLARHAAAVLAAIPGMEIAAEPGFTVVVFRLHRGDGREADLEGLNRAFLDRILARRRVHLTGTLLQGRYVLRLCILSFRTHLEHVDEALQIIREEAARL